MRETHHPPSDAFRANGTSDEDDSHARRMSFANGEHEIVHATDLPLTDVHQLRIEHVVLSVNKMDLISWDEAEFDCIAKEVSEYVQALPTPVV